jgi:hypothetical protein
MTFVGVVRVALAAQLRGWVDSKGGNKLTQAEIDEIAEHGAFVVRDLLGTRVRWSDGTTTVEAPEMCWHTDAEIVPSPQDWDDARAVAMRAVDRFRAMVPRPTAASGGTLSLLIAEFAFELACRAKKAPGEPGAGSG